MIDPRLPPYVCQFDQTVHDSLDALHAHIKRFKVSRERYYHQYYPRHDPVTGELIPFTELDKYCSQEFVSKVTLKKWLGQNPVKGFEWAKQWLLKRKDEKNLVYAPSQAELRALCCPSMPYYDEIGKKEGGYYGITRALGFADRYKEFSAFQANPLPADCKIIQDTRESTPIKLSIPTIEDTVSVGDYRLADPHDNKIRIERKSLADFCGTLSQRKVARKGGRRGDGALEDCAFQRFERELDRACEQDLYVVMMVESIISHAQIFNKLPQTRWIKASPDYILHNLRTLLHKYPLNFQALFVDGRVEMARVMPRVFMLGQQVKQIDLQYAYERGLL